MKSSNRIMIIAGEPSGDRIGALLAKSLLKKNPALSLCGLGGGMMKEAGVHLLEDMTHWAVVGLVEVLKNYRNFRRVFHLVCEELDRERPKAVVLIDFPGFNLKLAKAVRKKGIRVIYYVSPQIWAWGKRRVRRIARTIDRMIVILPFERDFYEKEGVSVDFVGHPLVDFYEVYKDKTDLRKELMGRGPVIGILPGSRPNEIERHLGPLVEAAHLLRKSSPGACFVIPCATDAIYDAVSQKIQGVDFIRAYQGSMKECLSTSSLAWVCSGTATLEAAYFGVPMIVIYQVSHFTAFLIRRIIRVPFVGLVNLVAQKKIVPELLQDDFKSDRVAQLSLEFLSNGSSLGKMREDLLEVRRKLGGPGASERAAEIILQEVNKQDESDPVEVRPC